MTMDAYQGVKGTLNPPLEEVMTAPKVVEPTISSNLAMKPVVKPR